VNAIPPISESEVRALADAIERAANSQPPDTVLKRVEMALARAPQQPLVLNVAGGYMSRSGNAHRARELFEKATTADGNSKVLWLEGRGERKKSCFFYEAALDSVGRYYGSDAPMLGSQ
jgi:hypothetical protein